MRRVLFVAAAVVLGLISVTGRAPIASAAPCPPNVVCEGFETLNTDIQTFVPTPFRAPLLTRSSQAERLASAHPCLSAVLLLTINVEVRGLSFFGRVTPAGAQAIRTDVSTIIGDILIPTEPCIPPSPI
jgi:hypothetical protein